MTGHNRALRKAYGLGPAIPPSAPAVSPLYARTEQAREHYRRICVAFSNQEATVTELVAAAETLRALQEQWKHA